MRVLPIASAIFALLMGSIHPVFAVGSFECPTKPLEGTQAAQVKALLPTGDVYEHIDQLNNAVTALKAEGTNPGLVVDRLIASYCPLVAADSGLTDAQKPARVMRFAARITRTVYSLDGADAIILDVALPPAMVNAINTKAKAAGISADAWIQSAVAAAFGGANAIDGSTNPSVGSCLQARGRFAQCRREQGLIPTRCVRRLSNTRCSSEKCKVC